MMLRASSFWLLATGYSLVIALRVEGVAQTVTEEPVGEHRQEDAEDRGDRQVRVAAEELLPLAHHAAPRGLRRPDADADEREERLTENRLRDRECHGDDQGRQAVRQEMPHYDVR